MTVIEIDKDASQYWKGTKTVSKLDEAIEQLRNVDVNDRQPVANALSLLEEARNEQGGEEKSDSVDDSNTGSNPDANV